jgi:hypothetical protein
MKNGDIPASPYDEDQLTEISECLGVSIDSAPIDDIIDAARMYLLKTGFNEEEPKKIDDAKSEVAKVGRDIRKASKLLNELVPVLDEIYKASSWARLAMRRNDLQSIPEMADKLREIQAHMSKLKGGGGNPGYVHRKDFIQKLNRAYFDATGETPILNSWENDGVAKNSKYYYFILTATDGLTGFVYENERSLTKVFQRVIEVQYPKDKTPSK